MSGDGHQMSGDPVREALRRYLAEHPPDPAFVQRLRDRIKADAAILARLD